ncbi:MAG: caspase family protein [Nitrospirae bacterium]|nr:MAG: caspase family protein [Nitrospirota bacterium]
MLLFVMFQGRFWLRRFKILLAVSAILALCFSSIYAAERSVSVKKKKGAETAATAVNSNYYAIIIGNNNYKHLRKLQTAVTDATEVEKLLKERYGFKTKLLLNATRSDILDGINEIREKLGKNDNLLVYYAGHGEYKKEADKAYWLPVDAHKDRTTNWIIADDITSNIKIITARHVLVVSDSCYSGTLTRAAATELRDTGERQEYLKKMQERPSRTLMASGGNEPVADGGGGKHSVFAAAFLKALKEADKPVFTADEIFHGRVKAIVAGKSDQVPEYNSIKNSGDEGGDFVFQVVGESYLESSKQDSLDQLSEEVKKIQEEKEKLKKEREYLEQAQSLIEERKKLEEDRKHLDKEKKEFDQRTMLPNKKRIGNTNGPVLYASGMGGHIAKIKIVIDANNEYNPIRITKLDRLVIGAKRDYPIQDVRIDYQDSNIIFWSTYVLDSIGKQHIGKTDLATGNIILDAAIDPDYRAPAKRPPMFKASGQSTSSYLPVFMGVEGYVDVFDKKTLRHVRRMFISDIGYSVGAYQFLHGTSSNDGKKFLIVINEVSNGKGNGNVDFILVDLPALERGEWKVILKKRHTGVAGRTIPFRQYFSVDDRYIFQSAGDRIWILDAFSLQLVDEKMVDGQIHDLMPSPDNKYAIMAMRQATDARDDSGNTIRGKVITDGAIQLYDFNKRKIIGNQVSVCLGCHIGMGVGDKSAVLGGIDAAW